jgi:hypothetical protein
MQLSRNWFHAQVTKPIVEQEYNVMNTRLTGLILFALTLAAVAAYPSLDTRLIHDPGDDLPPIATENRPRIDVVFVLDTTGSMGGLIQTAKDKIGRSPEPWHLRNRHRMFASVSSPTAIAEMNMSRR